MRFDSRGWPSRQKDLSEAKIRLGISKGTLENPSMLEVSNVLHCRLHVASNDGILVSMICTKANQPCNNDVLKQVTRLLSDPFLGQEAICTNARVVVPVWCTKPNPEQCRISMRHGIRQRLLGVIRRGRGKSTYPGKIFVILPFWPTRYQEAHSVYWVFSRRSCILSL